MRIELRIAKELNVNERQYVAAIEFLDGCATVPFIARYRRAVTGGLAVTLSRYLVELIRYLRDLVARQKRNLIVIAGADRVRSDTRKELNE